MANLKHSSLTLAVLVATSSFTTQVYASGFQVSEHSATGLGRAFAGEAAIGDNASVVARNPAGMTLIDRAQFSGAISVIDPEIDLTDYQYGQKSKDIAPTAIVPAGYYVSPINERWSWGIGLFSTYGVTTDYPTSIAAGQNAGYSSLVTINLNPSLAFKVNEHLSLGAGFNIMYSSAELERRAGALGGLFGGDSNDRLLKIKGDDFGYGWNAGALFELDNNNRWGVAYRSSVAIDFDGDLYDYYNTAGTNSGGSKQDGRLKLNMPDILEISGFHQLNPQWALHYSYLWTNWSRFTQILATDDNCSGGVCLQKKESYHDSNRYAIGATYTYNPDWTFRAGFAYDEQAGKPTISIPDTDRYWYSAGLTYNWSEDLSIDAAFTYIDSDEQNFKEEGILVSGPYKSKGPAYVTALQMNYSF